jgi:uncharacterized membrane protein YoaK (UPF0700 family)
MDQSAGRLVFLHWLLLSLNAGCINSGGFLAAGQFVSHVTGFATLFGVNAAESHLMTAVGTLSVPLFFLLGSVTAGLLIDRPVRLGRKPHFDYVMLISSLCLFACAFAGRFEQFGVFGEEQHLRTTYFLLVLLCLSSGLQNAAITASSGSSVRTTHLTGITTDLGLGIARIISNHDRKDSRVKLEAKTNWLRIATIVSFTLGSAIGAWLFLKVEYLGFLLPACISLYSAIQGRNLKMNRSRFSVLPFTSKDFDRIFTTPVLKVFVKGKRSGNAMGGRSE